MVIISSSSGGERKPVLCVLVRGVIYSPAALPRCQLPISALMEAPSKIEAEYQYELQIHVYLTALPPFPSSNECSLKISSTLNCFTAEALSCESTMVTYRRKQNLKPQTE